MLTIDVVDEHAASYWAIEELGRQCACAIAYEEPAWAWAGDLEIMRDGRSGRTVRASRRSSLRLSEPVVVPMTKPPLIDTPITIEGPPALPALWLIRVARSLSATTGRDIRPMMSGNAVNLGAPISFAAHAVPASEVVRRLFEGLDIDVAWRLSYGRAPGTFGLGIRTARRQAPP